MQVGWQGLPIGLVFCQMGAGGKRREEEFWRLVVFWVFSGKEAKNEAFPLYIEYVLFLE
ncbi:hypothetical protein GCM10023183_28880 [Nibribacter koreensis]|uniref:Uncharacterized protein n=1 Tax=Nibribacter koreensis TaxID=1084519 RepID=A0ABP8FTJ6_9BACT